MKFEIPTIYPITDARLSGTSHTEQAKRLIGGGARIVQFREKYAAPLDWFDDLSSAVNICRENAVISIVNDRVDMSMAVEADGVHLGQNDLPPDAARRVLGDAAIIGYSTHTLEQVRIAVRLPINYIAFGPIFPTNTKKDADEVVGLTLLHEVRKIVGHIPLVAIGGIKLVNAASIFAAGAASIAVISEIIADEARIGEHMSTFLGIYD